MTDRQLRDLPRINYQVLATTGETVHIDQVPQDPTPAEGLSDDNSSSSGLSGSGSEGSLDRTLIAEAKEMEIGLKTRQVFQNSKERLLSRIRFHGSQYKTHHQTKVVIVVVVRLVKVGVKPTQFEEPL